MTSKLGMIFSGNVPDFGSIEQTEGGDLLLLAADIPKLNSALTRAVCAPLLADGSVWSIPGGKVAIVANWKTAESAKAYIYHSGSDAWYEVVDNDG